MQGISLIIPIYNVEPYVEKCLQSVVQSMKEYTNVEVLLVDVGSTDQSGAIAKYYADSYEAFSYVYKEKIGQGSAKNVGLQLAKYDYIGFLDSYDVMDERYFDVLIPKLRGDVDLYIFHSRLEDGLTDAPILKGIEVEQELWTIEANTATKLFHKRLFKNLKFNEGIHYEDTSLMYQLIYFVHTWEFIDEVLHHYHLNRKGRPIYTISPKINDIYAAFQEIYDFYELKNALTEKNIQGMSYQYVKHVMWSNMHRQARLYKWRFLAFYKKMRETREQLYNWYPNWKKNELFAYNDEFFVERFGHDYIRYIDAMGKTRWSTLWTTLFVACKYFFRI